MKRATCSLVLRRRPSNFWKFDTAYPIGYGFAATKAGYGDLGLRHVVAADTLSFSCRTKAATSALGTKIVYSSVALIDRAAYRLLVFSVVRWAKISQMGSTTNGAEATTGAEIGADAS